MKIKYPVYVPYLHGNEKKYVNRCLKSTWVSSKGEYISTFEAAFSRHIGSAYATVVSNGTVAIHDALIALDIKKGDEVIVPTFTYIASVNPIRYVGATPVFVDSLEDTWQMDPDDIRRKITPRTKAILVVHLYGFACDMTVIKSIASENGLFIIEDCAEAFGTTYKGTHVGTFGDISTFSFFGNKTITTGEGGMIVTDNPELYNRSVFYKGQAVDREREYWHGDIGYNYRMTNICAAIGLAQLEQADKILRKKREIARMYYEKLTGLNITLPPVHQEINSSYWLFSFLAKSFADRENIRHFLMQKGIETRPGFYPAHTLPMYSANQHFPVAENIGSRLVNLPSYPALSPKDVSFISNTIRAYYEH